MWWLTAILPLRHSWTKILSQSDTLCAFQWDKLARASDKLVRCQIHNWCESGENYIPFFCLVPLYHQSISCRPADTYSITAQGSINGCNLNIKASRRGVGRSRLETSLSSVVSQIICCLLKIEVMFILHFLVQ